MEQGRNYAKAGAAITGYTRFYQNRLKWHGKMKLMKRNLHILLLFTLVLTLLLSACAGATFDKAGETGATAEPAHDMRNMFPEVEPVFEKVEHDDVLIEFTVKAEDPFLGNTEIAEGAYATVRFRVTNLASGNPLTDVRPAAWMDLQPTATSDDEQACQEKVAVYLKGQICNRPLVDLNSFFILAMNSGNSISVIDPLVQVGGVTQLYTTLLLESPGEDWVASPDGNRLYVSLPKAGKVAVADLQAFRVTDKVPAGDVLCGSRCIPVGRAYGWAMTAHLAAKVG
jgi:hypothetical protein